MKRIRMAPYALIVGILTLTLLTCEEDPISIYDPDETGDTTPVVTSVAPDSNFSADGVTFSGVGVVMVTGQYFSETASKNLVFFDGSPGEVLSSTSTSLRVRVPDVEGDSIMVKVSVQGAFDFATLDGYYTMVPAVQEIGGFDDLDQLYAIACDETETLWITSFGNPTMNVITVEPDSLKATAFSTLTVSSTSLKYAGNDRLFLTGGALLYTMNRATGSFDPSIMFQVAQSDVTLDVDIVDQNQAFMAIKKSPNLGYIMSLDLGSGNIDTAAAYDSLGIQSIRIFEDDIYVAGSYQVGGVDQSSAVWKNSISGATLGARELVVDLADYPEYEGVQISAITFSADGKMFIGLNSVSAILVYDNGILSPFYDPILSPPTADLTWGNGNYLYQLKTTRVNKIDMVEAGAVYGGRD